MITRAQGAPFILNFDERSMAGLVKEGIPKDEAEALKTKLEDYALDYNKKLIDEDEKLNKLKKDLEIAQNETYSMARNQKIINIENKIKKIEDGIKKTKTLNIDKFIATFKKKHVKKNKNKLIK